MSVELIRKGLTALIACVVVSAGAASAQPVAQGWPGQAEATAMEQPVKKKPAAAPVSSRAKVTAAATIKPSAAPKLRLADKPAAAPVAAPAAAPVAAAPTPAGFEETMAVLTQQAELLKRLVAEVEAQRGVIAKQQEQILSLERRAAAGESLTTAVPSPSPAAPVAAPAKAPAEAEAAPPPPPVLLLDTGGVKLKAGGLVQGWYQAADQGGTNTFRVRRTEIKIVGEMSSHLKWTVMVDPSKNLSLTTSSLAMDGQNLLTNAAISQSGKVLQDAFVSMSWKPYLGVEVGQQKVPLSMEGVQSSGKLDTIERALFMSDKSRGGGYGDVRDLGVIARGKVWGGQVEYTGGLFNGLGENFNDIDRNQQKTSVARIVARPRIVPGLQVGGSFARDGFWQNHVRDRQGLELAWSRRIIGVKGEYMGGRDGDITRQGGYAQATARLAAPLTAVFRYDTWDPDTRSEATSATVTEKDWLGGLTYVLSNTGVWFQANYIRKTYDGVIPSRNVILFNVQTAF